MLQDDCYCVFLDEEPKCHPNKREHNKAIPSDGAKRDNQLDFFSRVKELYSYEDVVTRERAFGDASAGKIFEKKSVNVCLVVANSDGCVVPPNNSTGMCPSRAKASQF